VSVRVRRAAGSRSGVSGFECTLPWRPQGSLGGVNASPTVCHVHSLTFSPCAPELTSDPRRDWSLVVFFGLDTRELVIVPFDLTNIMTCKRNMNRCSLLLSSVMVCMTNRDNVPLIGTDAYSSQLIMPLQSYKRCFRLSQTKLHASAPVANGLVAQEHTHSTSSLNVGYDAQSILNFYDRRPWEIGFRLNMLGLPLLGE